MTQQIEAFKNEKIKLPDNLDLHSYTTIRMLKLTQIKNFCTHFLAQIYIYNTKTLKWKICGILTYARMTVII